MGRLQVSGKDEKQFLVNFYRYWNCLGGSMKIHSPSLTAKMNLKTFDKVGTDNF